MAMHRIKHSFTAGELSPLMNDRVDFDNYRNGCKKLENMFCVTQGPAVRRPGFKFIYDLNRLGMNVNNPQVRMIPFIFNEIQAYAMIFYRHTDGSVKLVFGTTSQTTGEDGLVVYGSPLITECPPGIPAPGLVVGDIVTLDLPADWGIEVFDWAQSGDEMYIAQPDKPPHIIKRHGHECWELSVLTVASQPIEWNNTSGWPEKVTFHQQRLVFGANLLRRQTVWMSQAGDFSNFGINSPLLDSDAVTFTLDSGTQNRIQWLGSGKSLHVGTLGNEWTVTGNDRSALTPSNILAQRQTSNGSEGNKPLLVGITTLFVERHGRAINEFVYDYTLDSYKTSDMAILSPHLTEHYSIVDWTYQQTPDSIIWCVRDDGTMLGITYQRQHKVVGWHRHLTQGDFKAITAIPGNTREDDVWTVVRRTIDGGDRYYVEKLDDWFVSEEAKDGRFLDSFTVVQSVLPFGSDPDIDAVSGLDHLIGEEVHILADGTVHPPQVVAPDGSIELNETYDTVVVGLPYVSEVRPHLPDVDNQREGTSRGRTQRITSVGIDFYRSLGAWIGRFDQEDGDYEEEIPFRVPGDLTGQAVPLFTGWYDLDFPEGYDREAEYFIRQKQPLPMTIRGVVDVVEVHE